MPPAVLRRIDIDRPPQQTWRDRARDFVEALGTLQLEALSRRRGAFDPGQRYGFRFDCADTRITLEENPRTEDATQ